MSTPITPGERAAMRERYAADLRSAWDTSAAAHARALRDLGTSARNDVPRLLDALDTAEAEAKHYRAQRDEWFLMESGARDAAEAEVVLLRTRIRKARHQRDDALAAARGHVHRLVRADDAEAKVERQRDRLRARERQVRRLRAEVTRLHALVADLRATASPAWDEEAAVEGMARAVYPSLFTDDRQPPCGEAHSDAELREGERDVARERMRQALAVVRDHLPAKPSREAVRGAFIDARLASVQQVMEDGYPSIFVRSNEDAADAALAGVEPWPGESRATVQAEAWDKGVATALDHAIRNEDGITLRLEHLDGRPWVNPYREGGADRG